MCNLAVIKGVKQVQIMRTTELYHIQEGIASKAIIEDKLSLKELKLVAGADQAFFYESKDEAEDKQEKIISAVVVLEYPSMRFIDYSYSVMPVDFPYVPGLLSFREAPAIINAFRSLKKKPELLVIDGCGINHPRFAGLATHVGVVLDVATIGVAKNLLCGNGEVPGVEGEERVIKYKGKHKVPRKEAVRKYKDAVRRATRRNLPINLEMVI
ncbi:MAG: hypothetical protein GH149_02320, partial [Methanosarcinales archaeon]|nr:hypothetical protein [Methanosarcinales archaeon]